MGGTRRKAVDYAVELVPTTRRRHITGTTALNIPGSYRLGGDWHEHSTWFSHRRERVNEGNLTNEETHSRLLDLLGGWGLRDARRGLARLGHPGAESTKKVWAASHDRAVVEAGWKQLIRWTACGLSHPPFDLMELERLLPYPDQWVRLHWWAWRLRRVMTPAELELWDRWRKQWTPWEISGRRIRRSH